VPLRGASREQRVEGYELCRAVQPTPVEIAADALHSQVTATDESLAREVNAPWLRQASSSSNEI